VEYFEKLMKNRINLSPEPKIPELNAKIQFNITGVGAGRWTLVLDSATPAEYSSGRVQTGGSA
jgi:hypothetical protein